MLWATHGKLWPVGGTIYGSLTNLARAASHFSTASRISSMYAAVYRSPPHREIVPEAWFNTRSTTCGGGELGGYGCPMTGEDRASSSQEWRIKCLREDSLDLLPAVEERCPAYSRATK